MIINIAFIVFVSIYLCIWIKNRHISPKIFDLVCVALMIAYVVDAALITLIREAIFETPESMLIPAQSYYNITVRGWGGESKYIAAGVIGNVVMFVPLGLFLGNLIRNKRSFLIVAVIAFGLTLTIETIQYFCCIGTFEVDDLINNTWGALIGYSICCVLRLKKINNWKQICKMLAPLEIFLIAIGSVCIISLTKYCINLLWGGA